MAIDTNRPSQKSQRSRRGKKAWRKNIDLDDFEQAVDERQEAEIVMGPEQELYITDKKGSNEGLTREMKSEKRLRSQEILYGRSAVPPILSTHKKKDQPKSKVVKDRRQLLETAGFGKRSARDAAIERDGILRVGDSTDIWGASDAPTHQPSRQRKAPDAPIPGSVAVPLPTAGQSYNPALEQWKATIVAEHQKIEKDEEKRLLAEEEQLRIDAIIKETKEKLANPESSSESDSEGEPGQLGRLSVNAPVVLKRKTRTQRNKERKHKEWLRELEQLRAKKLFMKKLAQEAEAKSVSSTPQEHAELKSKERMPIKLSRRAHSAHSVADEPLAIKLSDELDDSMRRLKPEGDIFKERFRSLQARGMIEARVPIKKQKHRKKTVEKWAFKHFS